MSGEQIEAIMQHGPTDRTGIGIKNVNDRLKIYFGKSYGLHITSELDVGHLRRDPHAEDKGGRL